MFLSGEEGQKHFEQAGKTAFREMYAQFDLTETPHFGVKVEPPKGEFTVWLGTIPEWVYAK